MTQTKLNVPIKKLKHQCDNCSRSFGNIRAFVQHKAIAHHSYVRGPIDECTLKSMENVWERTLELMIQFRECRKPDNSGLFIKAAYYYCGLTYDPQQQGITDKDGKAIPYPVMVHALRQLESYRRRRQEIQQFDREEFHAENDDGSAGVSLMDHFCLLPTSTDQALAKAEEVTVAKYYAGMGRGIDIKNTFIPSTESMLG